MLLARPIQYSLAGFVFDNPQHGLPAHLGGFKPGKKVE
ncbi:hypothetical protein X971_4223 [Agrobacterium tumefaciens LBA4213 (Ach5)]|nr:hypothetical protein X971_4223 [Agrobacterium tumefaciens LBA4213 (Ach5)]